MSIICANIVADVIIRMAADAAGFMNKGGVLLASGIISSAGEVAASFRHGLCELERIHDNGWCALVFGEGREPECRAFSFRPTRLPAIP